MDKERGDFSQHLRDESEEKEESRRKWEDNIKIVVREVHVRVWIELAVTHVYCRVAFNTAIKRLAPYNYAVFVAGWITTVVWLQWEPVPVTLVTN
jgi:hypothetical protein